MERGNSQQSPACLEPILDKSEIHKILEGMFLQQVMDVLSPCLKIRHSQSSVADSLDSENHTSQLVDSPSESMPEIVGTMASQILPTSDLDFVKSEILQRTGALLPLKRNINCSLQ